MIENIRKVNRVDQHLISKNNDSNYMIRQVFIITSKLAKDEDICEKQKLFLENSYKLKTKIKGNLQQVRIIPRGSNYLLEVVHSLNLNYENRESKNVFKIHFSFIWNSYL